MPLKHDTETVMVFVLGLLIVLAGAAAAFLPPISVSIWPWVISFIIALAYPLVLYPMLKERRADYEFRALHFVPALILLVWLALDLLAAYRPDWQVLQSLYTWGWSLAVVAAAFVLIVLFCLRVIRQRWTRLGLLAAVFLAFLGFSQVSQQMEWDRQVAMFLWNGEQTGSGLIAGGSTSGNLAPSGDSQEEQWRQQLRRMEQRRQELARASSQSSSSAISAASVSSAIIAVQTSSQSSSAAGTVAPPPQLSSSGFGMETVGIMLVAGYCTAVQRKTIRRSRLA